MCVRLLHLLHGPDRALTGADGLTASAASSAKGPSALLGHLPERSGQVWSQVESRRQRPRPHRRAMENA